VTQAQLKNMAASVRQRLLNRARETGRPFSELLQYFAMERFLYRVSKSPHAGAFVLKGALMLAVWDAPAARPTMDIDMLGRLDNSVDSVVGAIQEICRQEVEPDGLLFQSSSVKGEHITEEAEYEGVRIKFHGNLGTARVRIQVDVGFGDVVIPGFLICLQRACLAIAWKVRLRRNLKRW